jgi:O-acetylserine/cysteine efflux transporter
MFLALIVAFCWGANFTAVKFGLEHFPPYFMLALRFGLVALLLIPYCLLKQGKPSIRMLFALKIAFILGTAHFALAFGAMWMGADIPTVVITVQLGVPFSCMLSAIWFNDKLGAWRSFGLMVSFMGIILIAGTPNVVNNFIPFCMVLIAALCWAFSNVMIKKEGAVNIFEMLGWMSLFAVPQLMVVSWVFEGTNQWNLLLTTTLPASLAIGFSSVFSTILAYGLWYYLLTRCEVSHIAPFNLLVPISAIGIGQIFYPVELTTQILSGGLITIAGVAIIVARRPRLAAIGKVGLRRKRIMDHK